MIFIAEKQGLPPMFFRMPFDCGNARHHGALEVLLQHGANRFRQSRIGAYRKVQSNHLALLDELAKRRQGYAITTIMICDRVVALLGRTKGSLHRRVVIKKRKENRDAFNDAGAKFRLDPLPVIVEPTLDSLKPLASILVVWVFESLSGESLGLHVVGDLIQLQQSLQFGGGRRSHPVRGFDPLPAE